MQPPWQDWGNLLLGIVILLSPAFLVLEPTSLVAWNAYVSGGIITLAALTGLFMPNQWEEWINLAVGLWVIASPFVIGFTGGNASMTMIGCGVLVFVLSVWALIDLSRGGMAVA